MSVSQVPPLSSNVPIVYPPGHPSAGCPTPAFATLMQILLDEKAVTDALAEGAIQPGTVTTSGLTAAAQRILGNKEATTGAIEELTVTEALDLIAGTAAQGDIFYRGATSVKRLPAGTSGQYLQTLGAGADPAWGTVTGGSGAMSLISSQTVSGASAATVSFTGIPNTYRDLYLVICARSTASATTDNIFIRCNGDSGSNYDRTENHLVNGANSPSVAMAVTAAVSVSISGATATANTFGMGNIEIPQYANTGIEKGMYGLHMNNATHSGVQFRFYMSSSTWRSTAAISRLDFACNAGNIDIGSTFTLYGRS